MMIKTLRKRCRLATAIAAAAVLTPVLPVSAEVTYDTRVLNDDAAPGTGEGVMFIHFRGLVLNDAGRIAFRGTVRGKDVPRWKSTDEDTGIWSDRSGSLKLVARTGDAAPGTDSVFKIMGDPAINGVGQIAFVSELKGNGVNGANSFGIWAEASGSLKLVARRGDIAPDTSTVFRFFRDIVINDAGQIAFNGGILSTSQPIRKGRRAQTTAGIWSEASGSLRLVVLEGTAAPGTDPSMKFRNLGYPVITDAGQTTFGSTIIGTVKGKPSTRIAGIWADKSGSLSLVARCARGGGGAPGTDEVFSRAHVDVPVINSAGQFAFRGGLQLGGAGIWAGGAGSRRLVARTGDAAPGTDGVFSEFYVPRLNGAGQTAFRGQIRHRDKLGGPMTSGGIWSEGSGSLRLVVLLGDAAPGTPEGTVFRNGGEFVLNGTGQIAFKGELSDKGAGIWATDGNGVLMLIAREGDLFDVNDDPLIDDLRTIREVKFQSYNNVGQLEFPLRFNDAGQLAFYLTFTDDSAGIFVATISNSAMAAMPPIQTKPSLKTDPTESKTTQDDAPIVRSQPQQAESDQGKEDRPGKTTPVLPLGAEVTYDTRALKGDAAPGTGEGVTFSSFRNVVLNDAGQIAFKGGLRGKDVPKYKPTNDIGIWADRSGSLRLVARLGDAAPGTDGVFSVLRSFSFNDAGQITIRGSARVNMANHKYKNTPGIWAERSGSLRLVARVGDAAPGTSGEFKTLDLPLLLNGAGQAAFTGTIGGRGRNQISGIWSEGSGSLRLVARAGDAAPGTEAVFKSFGSPFLLNSTDQLAFSSKIKGKGVTDSGIWSEESGLLRLVARSPHGGDAVPGLDGMFFRSPLVPMYNGAGQFAFKGGGGIWSDRSGSLKLIVRSGDAAPGTAEGVVFGVFREYVLFNDAGQIAFCNQIKVKGSDRHVARIRGIWAEGSGSLRLVALTGDPAPGTPEGVVFSRFHDVVLNGAGQTAFLGKIKIKGGGNPSPLTDTGIWATDSIGQLMLIAREGALFDVNDDPLIDDLRTIREVTLSSFNAAGQLAFNLSFTGGAQSGIFIATLPKPSTAQ